MPFDWVEEKTTLMAHKILVNSKYTASVFLETFRSASSSPEVLYPSINLKSYDASTPACPKLAQELQDSTCFVSINRFERKKEIELALKAFAGLEAKLSQAEFSKLKIVLAGGYDPRVRENVEYKQELEKLSDDLGIRHKVIFKPSFSNEERSALLSYGFAVVYTPSNEHFGIVPIEAMYSQRPIIACNSGGPTESILHEETGLLSSADSEGFSSAMARLLKDRKWATKMGEQGKQRVLKLFSLEAFASRLHSIVIDVLSQRP